MLSLTKGDYVLNCITTIELVLPVRTGTGGRRTLVHQFVIQQGFSGSINHEQTENVYQSNLLLSV
jgi:hypothetical protein